MAKQYRVLIHEVLYGRNGIVQRWDHLIQFLMVHYHVSQNFWSLYWPSDATHSLYISCVFQFLGCLANFFMTLIISGTVG